MEGNSLFGSNNALNSDYKVDIQGSLNVSGTLTNIDTEQLIVKDNCIGIGVNSTSKDNFMNGFFFPRRDQFLGSGNDVDKILTNLKLL